MLLDEYGGKMQRFPRINEDKNHPGVKMPDFRVDYKTAYDLKTLHGSGKNLIDSAIKNRRDQAKRFVLDVSSSQLSWDELMDQKDRIFENPYRSWVEQLIFVKDGKIVSIFERT